MKHRFPLFPRLLIILAILLLTISVSPALAGPGPWRGEYFANPNLEGAPVVSREDAQISFDWGGGSPDPAIPADNFSVRWTRQEWFASGTYRFLARSDDGMRILLDGQIVWEEWRDRNGTWAMVDRYVQEGLHTVVVEYFEHTGAAAAQVGWEEIAGGAAWRGEYYSNQNLEGSPALLRDDRAIDFDWGSGSPDASLPADHFSVRWTRTLGFTAGTYRFLASCDDGVRLSVDGQRVIDAWRKQSLPNTRTGEMTLSAGQHTIVVEYFEEGGEAAAHVWWEPRGTFTGWQGRYFDNRDLVGGPALVRDDGAIDFDWGIGAPADWMPDDNFSVRWTRTVTFSPGYYTFCVRSDDGFRLWVDDALVMNLWQPMAGELHYQSPTYLQGSHVLTVEYYEQNGHALVHFWWEPASAAGTPVPALTPAPTGTPQADPWHAEYFANPDLSGAPALTRQDPAVDYEWGTSAPAPNLPADGFSVRWSQPFRFAAGTYRFTTTTDDGVRLWVDDRLLIDAWRPMRGSRSATIRLEEGIHQLRMEYFDQSGTARARLTWQRVTATVSTPAPSSPPSKADRTFLNRMARVE